jgi:hypothetical protein
MTLRDAMPTTATFIDDLRAAFGADGINANIKKGIAGLPGFFYSCENGQQVGTQATTRGTEISVADMVLESINPMKAEHANRNHRR